jgi:hypothetical protein
MTSSHRRILQGTLSLAVVLSVAAEARAQKLETPGAAAAEPAPTTSPSSGNPGGFGDSGMLVISAERLFGYTWDHESSGSSTATRSTFTILGNPFGTLTAYPYDGPRIGFDYFVTKSISAGAGLLFGRSSSGTAASNNFQVNPRIGYGLMVGPWLAVWPRAGLTYVYQTLPDLSYLGLTIDLTAVIVVASHLAITFAPVVNVGLSGTAKATNGTNGDIKFTTLGAEFGLAMPF